MAVAPKIIAADKLGPNRTMMVLQDDRPLVERVVRTRIYLRPSTTAHGRVKAALGFPVGNGQVAGVAEFRLEMN